MLVQPIIVSTSGTHHDIVTAAARASLSAFDQHPHERIEIVGDATKDGQDYRLVELGMK